MNEILEKLDPSVPPPKKQIDRVSDLTVEQKAAILQCWNGAPADKPVGLQELIDAAWPGENIDYRSPKGMLVRKFLASRNLNYKKVRDYVSEKDIELTEEYKAFIIANARIKNACQIVREWLKDPQHPSTTKAVRRTKEFMDNIDRRVVNNVAAAVVETKKQNEKLDSYDPPKTYASATRKVNEFSRGRRLPEVSQLSTKQKTCLDSLIGYLHTPRFVYQMNSYQLENDRMLFESEFVRWTWDKPDLTEEDIDQLIVWAIEVVSSHDIQKRIEILKKEEFDLIASGQRVPQVLSDSISGAYKDYDATIQRQGKLYQQLTSTRSDRLKKQIEQNASILNLVNIAKEKESRDRMIKLAIKKKEVLENDIKEMMSMSEMKLRVMGISENELLYSP